MLKLEDYATPVLPRLYLGGKAAGANKDCMRSAGITHVLVAAAGLSCEFPSDFAYLSLPLADSDACVIGLWLPTARAFIRRGMACGSVLVHCAEGKSRSVAVVLDYLLNAEHFGVFDAALAYLRKIHPDAMPNHHFTRYLRTRYAAPCALTWSPPRP